MYCSKCGADISPRAAVCRHCGAIVSAADRTSAAPPRRAAPAQPANSQPGQRTYTPPQPRQQPTEQDSWYDLQPTRTHSYAAGPDLDEQRAPGRRKSRGLLIGVGVAILVIAVVSILLSVLVNDGDVGGVISDGGAGSYDQLAETYFETFHEDDADDMAELYPVALRVYYEDKYDSDDPDDFLQWRDVWYDSYGTQIERWEIVDTTDYPDAWVVGVNELIGVDATDGRNVEVEVLFEGEDAPVTLDMDMIRVDGRWLLYDIW